MCTRTKTSYGCGHSLKKTVSCKEKRCAGLERYHFEHDGDCTECRELTRLHRQGKSGAANPILDRGKAGLGRYGKLSSRDQIEEDELETDEYARRRRGRSTSRRVATGALESEQIKRQVLRELQQQPATTTSGHRQRSSSKSYKAAQSQPLNCKQASYTASYKASATPAAKTTSTKPKQNTYTPSQRAPSHASCRTATSSSRYDTGFGNPYPSGASNKSSHYSETTTTTRYHVYYPPTQDAKYPVVVNVEERVPSSSSSSAKSYSSRDSTSTKRTTSSHPKPGQPWRHIDPRSYDTTSFSSSAPKPRPYQHKTEKEEISGVRIREVFPDNRTGGWVYGEVEEVDDDDVVVVDDEMLGRGYGIKARGTW